MTNVCRIGWFEGGRVKPFIPGRHKAEASKGEVSIPASLKSGPQGIKIVEVEIDGNLWFGRLAPRREGLKKGTVLLFRSTSEPRASRPQQSEAVDEKSLTNKG